MTADEVRKLMTQATTPDPNELRAVLGLWYHAIRKAATAGRASVRETELDRVRMPIQPIAKAAAIEQLRRDGFTARPEPSGPCESEMTVSWK